MEFIDFLLSHPILSGIALVLVVLLIANELSGRLQKYANLSVTEVARKTGRENTVLIDVREPDEWRAGHIKGARHIPLGKLSDKLDELKKKDLDKDIVIYCRSGNRSATAASMLVKAGFEQVGHLAGGIIAWEAERYPISKKK
ncbi:MAG TPA: rhodanese-like domain-containing protein [Halothiobacillaceae bacterium]|nr:rhodanese-like domain-containing protein [Halothiobacillaceae bacterium]